MGLNICWVAVEGSSRAALLAALGLREVGAENDEVNAAYACAETPKGWTVVAGRGRRLERDRLPASVRSLGPTLAGQVVEAVNHASLHAWGDGGRDWSVVHSPDEGADLRIDGEAPPHVHAIAARTSAEQASDADVDLLLEAPLEIGLETCGYRPGEMFENPWTLLEPAPKRDAGPALSALPEAIRQHLLPRLTELGWTLAPVRLEANGFVYPASRVHGGRLQALRFLWLDDRRSLEVIPAFAILDGPAPDAAILSSGRIQSGPGALAGRRATWWDRLRGRTPAYDELVKAALETMQAELPELDQKLRSGELTAGHGDG